MPWWNELKFLVRKLDRRRADEEMEEEIRFHLELETQEQIEAGLSPEEARYAAQRKFGGPLLAKERSREVWGFRFVEELWQDLRYGGRILRKQPGFTFVAVLTLALGVGATTAIFSLVHSILLRPIPLREPDDLVRIYETNPGRNLLTFSASIPNYASWQEQAHSLDLAAFQGYAPNWTGDDEPERLEGIAATSSFLHVLGTDVQLGRWFVEEEQQPGHHRVAVLSDGFWRRRFGHDTGVVGRKLLLNGEPYTVLGVMSPGVTVPSSPDLWVPLIIDPKAKRGDHQYTVIGRLKAGFIRQQAQAEMDSIAREL